MSTLSCFPAVTLELGSSCSRFPKEIPKERERWGRWQQLTIVKAIQNDSNYEREEQRWTRDEQRWLREEERWLREEKRWEREAERLAEANHALQAEVRALKKELQEELRAPWGYGGEITDVSLQNLVAGMRNLLQSLAVPGSEELELELPVLDRPEEGKQIASPVPQSEGSSSTLQRNSESAASPSSSGPPLEKISAVVIPTLRGGNDLEAASPTKASPNLSKSTNGATHAKRTLKSGMEGDDVKELHDALSELGFYSGEEDIEFSVFSDGTDSAVKTWQSTCGVLEDGKVTEELMAALLAEVAAKVPPKADGAKSNFQPVVKVETTKPTQPSPKIKQSDSTDDIRKREINRYERSDAQETGTGSSRRVYLLGENRWEEPDRVQKKQEEERRIKNGQTSRMKVGAGLCLGCRGVGTMLCTDCEGTGDLNVEEQFLEWLDEGEAKCPYCDGSGAIQCDVCFGVVPEG